MTPAPMRHAFLLCLVSALAITACGDDGSGDDDDTAMPDAGPLMSELFGECNVNTDCVEYDGEGPARCLPPDLGFAEGQCSRRCDGVGCRDAAGRSHICLDSDGELLRFARTAQGIGQFCYQLCGNSNDCPTGQSCVDNTCIPWTCGPDGACGGDAVCGPGGTCVDPGSINTAGNELGEVCGGDPQCQSDFCGQAVFRFSATATQCLANCALPVPGYNDINFYEPDVGEPMELPSGTCTGDTVCVPALMTGGFATGTTTPWLFLAGSVGQQDPGRCVKACRADGDCGAGQICVKDIQLGQTATAPVSNYERGFCVLAPAG